MRYRFGAPASGRRDPGLRRPLRRRRRDAGGSSAQPAHDLLVRRRAQALAATGSWLRLKTALGIFERQGAQPWARRAGGELRAAGLSASPSRSPGTAQLTHQELEIATLAASGLTNKQIAERLYLSHRTVSSHLHKLFPKLGVTSRAACAPPSPPRVRSRQAWPISRLGMISLRIAASGHDCCRDRPADQPGLSSSVMALAASRTPLVARSRTSFLPGR
jgi:DNA-binding CsgD family transcriptional regulator